MAFRVSLLALALAFPIGAQSDNASAVAPLQVLTRIASVDVPSESGQTLPGTGVFFDVLNSSNKNVRSYALEIKFIDPSTNAPLPGRHQRAMSFDKPIHPGSVGSNPKPIVLPKTASGALAEYRVNVDLVTFDDGTTWGPGKDPVWNFMRQQLEQLQLQLRRNSAR